MKSETSALYLAARHPKTPWYAKLFVAGIVAYALSPIDLIPPPIMRECRERSQQILANGKPVSRVAGTVIALIWVALGVLCIRWVL